MKLKQKIALACIIALLLNTSGMWTLAATSETFDNLNETVKDEVTQENVNENIEEESQQVATEETEIEYESEAGLLNR